MLVSVPSGTKLCVLQEEESTIMCQDDSRHGFQDGDYVTFTEVQGMKELNRCEPRQIKVLGEYTLVVLYLGSRLLGDNEGHPLHVRMCCFGPQRCYRGDLA